MAARRQLVEGLKPENAVDRSLEEEFIYNGGPKSATAPKPPPSPPATEPPAGKGRADSSPARIPLTVRFRADYATALKEATLKRKLEHVLPNSLQDILEEAVEPWLRANGYLP